MVIDFLVYPNKLYRYYRAIINQKNISKYIICLLGLKVIQKKLF